MSGDLDVLYFFNRTIASPALDGVMNVLTHVRYWIPLYAIGGIYLVKKYRMRGVFVLIAVLAIVAICDQLASQLLKPLFASDRPCSPSPAGGTIVEWLRLPIGPRMGFGFPSNHAVNNFAVATFLSMLFNETRWPRLLFIPAFLAGISRVYLGLHYPSDVLGGAVIGLVLGVFFILIYRLLEEKVAKSRAIA